MTDSKKTRSKPSLRGSQASFSKKKVNTKTSDIYERFLNRVQQIEAPAKNPSTTKAPSAVDDGLDFDLNFTLPAQSNPSEAQASTKSTNSDNDFIEPDFAVNDNITAERLDDRKDSDKELLTGKTDAPAEPVVTQTSEENHEIGSDNGYLAETHNYDGDNYKSYDNDENKTTNPADQKGAQKIQLATAKAEPSRLKTLVVGVICGLVISGSAIAILNSLGVISLQPQNQQATAAAEPAKAESVAATKDSSAETADTAKDSAQTRAEAQPAPPKPDEKVIKDKSSAAQADSKPAETAQNQHPNPAQKPQPSPRQNDDLSYQDFAEEAGTTLYRDTN